MHILFKRKSGDPYLISDVIAEADYLIKSNININNIEKPNLN